MGAENFEQRVNEVVSHFTTDDKGNAVLPEEHKEGVDEAVLFAAMAEKRRRDTQAAFTKAQQQAKTLEIENAKLKEKWKEDAVKNLPHDKQEELDLLKHENPDAYIAKVEEYRAAAGSAFDTRLAEVSTAVVKETELDRRARIFAEFQESNKDIVLNDDIIANDIPPRFTKQLESGEVTFEEFLTKCSTFLRGGKVLATTPKGESANTLQDVGGRALPPADEVDKAARNSYKNEVY